MKKLLNDPASYVDEALDGLTLAFPSLVRRGPTGRVVARAAGMTKGRVGIATGGGFGHLPLFAGYVGRGFADSCSVGNVFEGPNVDNCLDAMRLADGGRGVLRLYGNYGGDRMNFDMAGEMLEDEGIRSTTVLGTDDIACGEPGSEDRRRGVAGLIYAYKIAGAAADEGRDLDAVTQIAARAVAATRTIGIGLSPCWLPQSQTPGFEIGEGEIEMGIGIHGEPGIWRDAMRPADQIADEMTDRLLADFPAPASGEMSVLVNGLGATPLEELLILFRRVRQRLDDEGITIVSPLVGNYVTSMEMQGASVSFLHLDDELKALLAAPADCPFWRVG